MRTLVLIWLVGCSSESVPMLDGPTRVEACAMTVDDYCAGHDCIRSLDDAIDSSSFCPASRVNCNGYDVIHLLPIDGESSYYYLDGTLVAFYQETFAGGSCVAGPATFAEPLCDVNNAPSLDACNSQ